jgi:aspartyl protease family protein
MDSLSNDQLAGLVFLGLILLMLSATIRALFSDRVSVWFRNLVLWLIVFAGAVVAYGYRAEIVETGRRALVLLMPGEPMPGPVAGSVVVAKGYDGHFRVRAAIGAHRVEMIVDTGASAVVLTDRDARTLGIRPDKAAYSVPTATANGRSSTAPVILDEIAIGGITLHNVPALVALPDALDTSLLGNTFLDRLKSFTVEGDRLILRR